MLRALDRLERPVAAWLDAWRWWLVGAVTVLYLSVSCVLARYRLFWNDELFTVYIAGLPSLSDIWAILASGVEQLPPTFHLLTRLVVQLLGEHHLTVRLPSIVAVGAMSVCLFVIVSRRSSTGYGLLAMLLPLATLAYPYAYEARPYGLVLAFSAASLLCWQSVAAGRRRLLSLAGLTVALAGAIASHYYAVLLFVPLALGEVTRSLGRRRLDPAVWLCFAVATLPLIAFLPLIQAGRRLAGTFWAKPRWNALVGFYQNVLDPAVVPLLVILVILALYAVARSLAGTRPPAPGAAPAPLHEVVAAAGYLAIPAIAIGLAKFVTGAFTDRYALPAVIGLSVIIPWGAYHLLDRRETMGAVLAGLLAGWFFVIAGIPAIELRRDPGSYETVYRLLRTAAPGGEPVVIASPHTFFQLAYYAPPDVASRLVYLADPSAALHHLHTDTPELGMRAFGRWTRLRIEDYSGYVANHPRFLLYADRGPWIWLLPALKAQHARFQLVALDGAASLLMVDAAPRPGLDRPVIDPAPRSSRRP